MIETLGHHASYPQLQVDVDGKTSDEKPTITHRSHTLNRHSRESTSCFLFHQLSGSLPATVLAVKVQIRYSACIRRQYIVFSSCCTQYIAAEI